MQRVVDIGRASQYEEAGRQPELRILAAIAGAQSAEQSAFMDGDVCDSRHVRFLYDKKPGNIGITRHCREK